MRPRYRFQISQRRRGGRASALLLCAVLTAWPLRAAADKAANQAASQSASHSTSQSTSQSTNPVANPGASQAVNEAASKTAGNAPAPTVLRLIALNDFHGYLDAPDEGLTLPPTSTSAVASPRGISAGGVARLSSLLHRLQAGHPLNLVVGAGDLVGASPFASALFHDEPSILAMNALGMSLSSVGNHEFDHGRDELLRLQHGGCAAKGQRGVDTCIGGDFPGAQFHYLAANVVDRNTGTALFAPYEIKTFTLDNGRSLRVGFIGLVLKQTATMVLQSGVADLEFRDEAASANALVPQLKAAGVDTIVLLIHQGNLTSGAYNDHDCPGFYGELSAIVSRLDPAIRVVVSGHTHQAYVCRIGTRLVTSAGSYGRLLTAIDLRFDASGALLDASADNVPVTAVDSTVAGIGEALPEDASLLALLAPYRRISQPLGSRVVAHLQSALSRQPNAAGESPLGDVVADSMLDAAKDAGAQIAFTNSGGLRQDLIPDTNGAITYAQLWAALPFGNTLVAMDLSGGEIKQLLRQQRKLPRPRPLQMSQGFSYSWSDGHVDGPNVRLDGKPLNETQTYRVVVNQFLAEGGDGFGVLKRGRNRVVVGHDLDAALAYLAVHTPLAPPTGGRVSCEDCAPPAELHFR